MKTKTSKPAPLDRSAIMRRVRSVDTAPELAVRRLVSTLGYRYRLHRQDLPGKPDIVFPSRKQVIFVNGCFWHGHHCRRGARIPKGNRAYWQAKITKNVERDKRNRSELRRNGWLVLTVWECEMCNLKKLEKKIGSFLSRKAAHNKALQPTSALTRRRG